MGGSRNLHGALYRLFISSKVFWKKHMQNKPNKKKTANGEWSRHQVGVGSGARIVGRVLTSRSVNWL